MNPIDILHTIWERTGTGHVFLPERHAETERWYEGDAFTTLEVDESYLDQVEGYDLYYTPITYTGELRRTEFIDEWGVLYADLDDAFDGAILSAMPATLLTETSPGRFQAVWFLTTPVWSGEGAELNRRLAHLISADHGAWIPTKVLRVPGSLNYKRGTVNEVKVVEWDPSIQYPIDRLYEDLPVVPARTVSEDPLPSIPLEYEWRALLSKYWDRFDHKTRMMLGEAQVRDRSLRLSQLATRLAKLGLPPEDTFRLLSRLPINKFNLRPDVLWKSVVLTAYN